MQHAPNPHSNIDLYVPQRCNFIKKSEGRNYRRSIEKMNNVINAARQRLTPECSAVAGTLLTMTALQALVLLVGVALAVALFFYYRQPYKGSDASDNAKLGQLDKKTKIITTLISASGIASLVSMLISLWMMVTSNRLRQCINTNL